VKNTHTPGPWTISGTHHSIGIAPDDGKSDGLASVFGCGPQAEANAALIAAAPDMFDALQAIVDAYGDRDTLLMAQCKAVLAKAKL
jgi:hypothetical protein